LNECVSKDPAFTEAYATRASVKEEQKDYTGALVDYSVVLDRTPDDYEARLGRANTLYRLGRYLEAKDDYLKILTLDPGETTTIYFQKSASPTGTMQITSAQSAFHPLIFNYLGLTEMKLGNLESAIVWLDSAIARNPKEADYYVNRGLARRLSKDSQAIQDFRKALSINPSHTAALSALASEPGSAADVEKYRRQAIESDSLALHPLLERAYARMQAGHFKEALADYDRALLIEGKNPEIWLNRGVAKEKLNDLDGAYTDYTSAIAVDERYVKAWLNRGNVLQKMGRSKDAVEDYSVAIAYASDYGAAYYNRAIAKERLRQKAEACEDLKAAERLGVKVDVKLRTTVCE
jgi:tetratricopeptide (TPR) repeat protein